MNHAIFIGGASTPKKRLATPVRTLGEHYPTVRGFTLAEYFKNKRKILEAIEGSDLYMHSAAAIIGQEEEARAENAVLLNPPFSNRLARSVWRATRRDKLPAKSGTAQEVGDCLGEILKNPFNYAFNAPELLGVDGIDVAQKAARFGREVIVVCGAQDPYFAPDNTVRQRAEELGVRLVILDGSHSAPNKDPRFLHTAAELINRE